MCEFCNEKEISKIKNIYEKFYIVKQDQKGFLIFLYNTDHGYAKEINFCPMCGRDLSRNEELDAMDYDIGY